MGEFGVQILNVIWNHTAKKRRNGLLLIFLGWFTKNSHFEFIEFENPIFIQRHPPCTYKLIFTIFELFSWIKNNGKLFLSMILYQHQYIFDYVRHFFCSNGWCRPLVKGLTWKTLKKTLMKVLGRENSMKIKCFWLENFFFEIQSRGFAYSNLKQAFNLI